MRGGLNHFRGRADEIEWFVGSKCVGRPTILSFSVRRIPLESAVAALPSLRPNGLIQMPKRAYFAHMRGGSPRGGLGVPLGAGGPMSPRPPRSKHRHEVDSA